MLILHLALISLLALTSKTAAVSIPGSITRRAPSLSSTPPSIPILPNSQVTEVDPKDHPDWAGELKPDDCRHAYGLMNGRVAYYNPKKVWMFWSRRWVIQPEHAILKLPFGTNYGGFHLSRSSRSLLILLDVAQGPAPS